MRESPGEPATWIRALVKPLWGRCYYGCSFPRHPFLPSRYGGKLKSYETPVRKNKDKWGSGVEKEGTSPKLKMRVNEPEHSGYA